MIQACRWSHKARCGLRQRRTSTISVLLTRSLTYQLTLPSNSPSAVDGKGRVIMKRLSEISPKPTTTRKSSVAVSRVSVIAKTDDMPGPPPKPRAFNRSSVVIQPRSITHRTHSTPSFAPLNKPRCSLTQRHTVGDARRPPLSALLRSVRTAPRGALSGCVACAPPSLTVVRVCAAAGVTMTRRICWNPRAHTSHLVCISARVVN